MNANVGLIAAAVVIVIAAMVMLGVWFATRHPKPMIARSPYALAETGEITIPGGECRTSEDVHAKYAALAETDPKLAGQLKYIELLRLHGK